MFVDPGIRHSASSDRLDGLCEFAGHVILRGPRQEWMQQASKL